MGYWPWRMILPHLCYTLPPEPGFIRFRGKEASIATPLGPMPHLTAGHCNLRHPQITIGRESKTSPQGLGPEVWQWTPPYREIGEKPCSGGKVWPRCGHIGRQGQYLVKNWYFAIRFGSFLFAESVQNAEKNAVEKLIALLGFEK